MKKIAYRWGWAIGLITNFLVASLAGAQSSFPTPPTGAPPAPITSFTGAGGVTGLFCAALDWIFWILIVLAVIMFLVGGYRYVTSGGEAERVSKANRTLLYAALAVVVGLIAYGMPYIIDSFFNGGGNSIGGVC